MNKKIGIIISIMILIIFIIVGLWLNILSNKEKNKVFNNSISNYNIVDIDENVDSQIEIDNENECKNNEEIDEIKNNYGITGDSSIYEVKAEVDGSKVLTVKANTKYKVAFAGMIKKEKPEYSEIDDIFDVNHPKMAGVWIENNSRNKILKYLNNNQNIKTTYIIDQDGYLKIKNKNNQTEYDKKIENYINSDKVYLINISSVCYIVDDITGKILDYNFEKMDKQQMFEAFEEDNQILLFINQNLSNQLSTEEILNAVINI